MEIEVLAIEVNEEPIELCKLLKIANLVSGGGEAKMVISQGYVYLNGELELQKRKKVYCEDIVQFNGEAIMPIMAQELIKSPLALNEPSLPTVKDTNFANESNNNNDTKRKKAKSSQPHKAKKNKPNTSKANTAKTPPKPGARRSIKF
ncbi:RNA-binding S4 domain-containing protein [Thalassotalea aquiviva]|uniref:RNA-binding S4 domain-containing protein n=1 Tax=Thalassotalea aquiviva TaxID=3242415 RepID=UPI00352B6A8E